MADIVIKNIEIPNTCRRCMEIGIPVRCRVVLQEVVTAVMSGYNRPSDCPLAALPEHGRLIDADAFKRYITEALKDLVDHPNYLMAKKITEDLCLDIDEAPTVLEANDNNDDGHSYEMQSDMRDYCERYEPTYNPEDGSM